MSNYKTNGESSVYKDDIKRYRREYYAGGAGRVGVGQAEDMTLDPMNYCINHPYKNNNNGGICAFCLQEKLGKLVSSSSPLPLRASSSSPSPPDAGLAAVGGDGGTSLSMFGDRPTTKDDHNVINNDNGTSRYQECHTRRARNIPLPTKKIMAPSSSTTTSDHHHHNHDHHDALVLKRSKSTAITPRSTGRFWSFLYLSSKTQNAKKTDKIASTVNYHDDDDDVRKVSRSRSVSCGSRSFSGDLFEKITGFGDCTLTRVESRRELKPKPTTTSNGGIKNSSTRGWTFASPIRAFSSKKDKNSNTTTTTPNLSAIPSLLAT